MRRKLQVVVEAAKAAGEIQLAWQRRGGNDRIEKGEKDGTPDFATKADIESQVLIVERLQSAFPGIPIVAEEDDPKVVEDKTFWLVDPVDGTSLFASDGDSWGSLISLVENGRPMLGVAYQPAKSQLLTVVRGDGCHLNEQPLSLSYKKPFREALIGTEIGWWCNEGFFRDFLVPLSDSCQGVVSTLSACGSTMDLIKGTIGAYVNLGVPRKGAKLWDFAVGALAIEELGGAASDPWGEALDWGKIPMQAVLSANQDIHDKLLNLTRNWSY